MGAKKTQERFIKEAQDIWGNTLDFTKVEYKGSSTKVLVICKMHGPWSILPSDLLCGHGCFKCKCENQGKLLRDTTKSFKAKVYKIYGNTFDLSKVNYKYSQIKVIIICRKHGSFSITPNDFLSLKGCSKCSKHYSPSTNEFLEMIPLWYKQKYDLTGVKYKKMHAYVKVRCKVKGHGVWKVTPANILSKHSGCPKCKNSVAEALIKKWLIQHNQLFETETHFKGCRNKRTLKFDFYLPKLNVLIEYDGIQHFKPVEWFGGKEALKSQQLRDKIKTKWAKQKGYKLLRIHYKNFKKIDKILLDFFTDLGYIVKDLKLKKR
jgi:very-short-patch-repair endonuclease